MARKSTTKTEGGAAADVRFWAVVRRGRAEHDDQLLQRVVSFAFGFCDYYSLLELLQ